jgi:hypothetical protein
MVLTTLSSKILISLNRLICLLTGRKEMYVYKINVEIYDYQENLIKPDQTK